MLDLHVSFLGPARSMWKFPAQGLNPCHGTDLSHRSDSTGSPSCSATGELPEMITHISGGRDFSCLIPEFFCGGLRVFLVFSLVQLVLSLGAAAWLRPVGPSVSLCRGVVLLLARLFSSSLCVGCDLSPPRPLLVFCGVRLWAVGGLAAESVGFSARSRLPPLSAASVALSVPRPSGAGGRPGEAPGPGGGLSLPRLPSPRRTARGLVVSDGRPFAGTVLRAGK